MLVVDAQVHPWKEGQSTGHHRRDPIDRDTLEREMAGAGVDRVVLVPPLWDPSGNAYALGMAREQPQRYAVMGLLDPTAPDAVHRLQTWGEQTGMRGVRLLLNTPDRIEPYRQGAYDRLWPVLEERRIVTALLAPGHLDIARRVAGEHPRLPLIVDHLGVPRGATGEMAFRHLPELLELASFENVRVKAAGVGDYALDPYPFKSLEAPLRAVISAFGATRVVWASDLSRLHHRYAQCVEHFRSLPFLSSRDAEAIMGGNMLELLDWR